MKLRSLIILLIIAVSLIPVYILTGYFKKTIRPADSFFRLFVYMISICALIFTASFGIVLLIKKLFPLP